MKDGTKPFMAEQIGGEWIITTLADGGTDTRTFASCLCEDDARRVTDALNNVAEQDRNRVGLADLNAQRRHCSASLPSHLALVVAQRDEAVANLHALLNHHRTATQMLEAERAARDWLDNIGSEAT